MTRTEIDTAIAAVNPVRRAEVEQLPLDSAEREMLDAILREPREEGGPLVAATDPAPRRLARPRFGGRSLALGATVAAAAVFFIAIGIGGGPASGPARAIGGDLARLVEASPPILLDAPGWRVERADESFMSEGSTSFHFTRPDAEISGERPPGRESVRFAELQWSASESARSRIRGLKSLPRKLRRLTAKEGGNLAPYVVKEVGEAPVLGTTARVLVQHYKPGPPYFDAAAIWEEGGQLRVLRSFVPDLQTFKQRLAALRRVDAETWLNALHGRVVRREHGVAVVPNTKNTKENK